MNPYAKTYKRKALLDLEKKKKGTSKAEKSEKKLEAGSAFLEGLMAP